MTSISQHVVGFFRFSVFRLKIICSSLPGVLRVWGIFDRMTYLGQSI